MNNAIDLLAASDALDLPAPLSTQVTDATGAAAREVIFQQSHPISLNMFRLEPSAFRRTSLFKHLISFRDIYRAETLTTALQKSPGINCNNRTKRYCLDCQIATLDPACGQDLF